MLVLVPGILAMMEGSVQQGQLHYSLLEWFEGREFGAKHAVSRAI
jgi:hypothetical protein